MSRAFRLGVFVVATLLVFAGGVFWIGSRQFMFSSTYRLSAEFQNVAGLSDGAEVRVGGIHQGTVNHIDLPRRPDEKIKVVMDLKGGTRNVVKKDSVAAIRSEGLVGDKYVEISFGSNQAAKVNDGDTIGGEAPLDISDLVRKTNGILDSAQGAIQSIDDSADNLREISSKLNQGAGTMGALINDRSMYQHFNGAANALQEDAEALKHNFLLRGFFRRRGYENSAELTKHAIPELPAKPYSHRFVFDADKVFDKPDTAKLKKAKMLDEAGKYLQENPFGLAVVAAYTDMKGDTEKDRVLTQARAMVARSYLVRNFKLDDTRIKTIGLGKSGEIAEGSRVEILVYPAGTSLAQNRSPGKQ